MSDTNLCLHYIPWSNDIPTVRYQQIKLCLLKMNLGHTQYSQLGHCSFLSSEKLIGPAKTCIPFIHSTIPAQTHVNHTHHLESAHLITSPPFHCEPQTHHIYLISLSKICKQIKRICTRGRTFTNRQFTAQSQSGLAGLSLGMREWRSLKSRRAFDKFKRRPSLWLSTVGSVANYARF